MYFISFTPLILKKKKGKQWIAGDKLASLDWKICTKKWSQLFLLSCPHILHVFKDITGYYKPNNQVSGSWEMKENSRLIIKDIWWFEMYEKFEERFQSWCSVSLVVQ